MDKYTYNLFYFSRKYCLHFNKRNILLNRIFFYDILFQHLQMFVSKKNFYITKIHIYVDKKKKRK